jgi:hypothetical protein
MLIFKAREGFAMRNKMIAWVRCSLLAAIAVMATGISGCGGGGGGGGGEPTPQAVSLTGMWDVIEFDTGSPSGWARFNIAIDGSGNIIVNSGIDDTGATITAPVNAGVKWVVDSSRIIREFDTSVTPNVQSISMYGTLASNLKLLVSTDNSAPSSYSMMVARKRDSAVTYNDVDIRGKSFALHQLNSGAANTWEYGFGSIDASGNVSIDSATDPSGPVVSGYPQLNVDNISVDSAGIVTNADSTFYGVLTTDKNSIFGLITEPTSQNPKNRLIAIQFLGQAYTPADLGGSWSFHALFGDLTPGWLRGLFDVSSNGSVTYNSLAYISEFGAAVPPANETLTISSSGIVTDSLDPEYHGQMAFGKDLYVRTQSLYPPSATRYSISIVLK